MIILLVNLFFLLSFFNITILSISSITICKLILALLLCLLVYQKIISGNTILGKKNNLVFNYLIIFMIFWAVYSFVSLSWSKDIKLGFEMTSSIIYSLCIVFLLIIVVKDKKDFFKIINLISISAILHSVIGYYEVFTKNYFFAPAEYISYYSYKGYPVSTFFNTNNFATYLSITFFMMYISLKNTKNLIFKIVLIISMISTVLLIVLTDSRGNLLAVIIGLIVIIFVNIRSLKWNKIQLLLAYILLLFGLIYTIYLFDSSTEQISNLFLKEKSFESNSIRINLWKNGIGFLTDTNLIGVGAGSLDYWMLNYSIYPTDGVLKMHNWWIELLSTYGVLVFVLYIFSYIKMYKYYFSLSLKKNFIYNQEALGMVGLMSSFIFSSISPSSLFLNQWIWPVFAIMIGGTNIFSKKIESDEISYEY